MLDERAVIAALALYAVMSVASFAVYARDKRASARGGWRTRERTLHTLDALGGWPGGLLAQRLLRHKNRKRRFRAVFWATVLLHAGVWVWLARW